MTVPIFRGYAKDGKLVLPDYVKKSIKNWLLTFKPDVLVEIIIRPHKKTKSDPMRKYYFGVVAKMIGNELGYTKDEIHEVLKAKFLSRNITIQGEIMQIPRSVFGGGSKMSVEEKAEFIEQVRRWAAEYLGLYIPDPNEVEV